MELDIDVFSYCSVGFFGTCKRVIIEALLGASRRFLNKLFWLILSLTNNSSDIHENTGP